MEKELPARFVSTFLGAHTIPSEYKNNRDRYIDIIINEMLPKVKKYKNCKFCDVFVENIAFTIDEARKICDAARAIGLRPRLHVDQLTAGGGALLAAEVDAISADHLEYVSDDGIKQLAQNGIVAVMLPGAAYFIKEKQQAPARKLIDAGVTVAVATDYNPGSNPCLNLFLTANMAISLMNMTVEESIKGITINAAKALDLDSKLGSIAVGKKADLLILNTSDEFMPFYRYDKNFVSTVIINGHTIKF